MQRRFVERSVSRLYVLALFLCAGLLLCAGTSFAQTESPEARTRRAQELSRITMSPFCPGRTLEGCPSPNAAAWRDDIRIWVDEGLSTEEIRQRLRKRMPGTDLTGAPSTALDAVLPVAVGTSSLLLLAALLRLLVLRKRRATGETRVPNKHGVADTTGAQARNVAAEPDPAKSSKLDARLDQELSALDE